MEKTYSKTVQRLLQLDMPEEIKFNWPDYRKMGLTEMDIPELIRMVSDKDLLLNESDESWVWGPVHAWRALGQLKAQQAVEPLVNLFENAELEDWIGQELPQVMAMIGPAAVSRLEKYAENPIHGDFPRIYALECLLKIAGTHPDTTQNIKNFFIRNLQLFENQSRLLNAFLIWFLIDLKVREAAPLMEQAFAANKVDHTVVGDWEDAQVDLGLLKERITPKPNYFWERLDRLSLQKRKEELKEQQKSVKRKIAKMKSKRKMASTSRKRQRRKKK
jgi:hypothetical protein